MIFNWGKKKKARPAEPGPVARDVIPDPAPQQIEPAPHDAAPAREPEPETHVEVVEPAEPDSAEARADEQAQEKLDPNREPRRGFFARIASGLKKSSSKLGGGVTALFSKRKLDEDALEDLEDLLLTADLGAGPSGRIIAKLSKDKFDKEVTGAEVKQALADGVADILSSHEADLDLTGSSPQVVLFVGVNGAGKTTTLGKIAALMKADGRRVVLAAGDTFRAAAVEQIEVWGERTGCPVIARPIGSDAAGLVYDAYETAKAQNADVLLVDTAGRLQNKSALMDELKKIVRTLKKHDDAAPHHVLLVLDATVGQNALSQADAFTETAGVTGLIMTKLDGTARGGVLVALADAHPELPIYFTGVGERVEDLAPFSADGFARALVDLTEEPEPA